MRKAQISIFLIVAIVILIAVGIFLSIKTDVKEDPLIPKVSSKLEPINSFVEQCIFDISTEGIDLAMQHGGYIYTDELEINLIKSTEGNAVEYVPNSNYKVPFWYYMDSKDTCKGGCQFKSEKLPLRGEDSVETQIERYIDENLPACLSNFYSFKELGYEVEQLTPPKSDVMIREDSMLIVLEMPLAIQYQDSDHELKIFRKEAHTIITELFEAASEITEYESTNCFLDEHMINVISYHGGLGKEIPPFSGASSSASDLIWIKQKVEKKVTYLTQSYIPLIRLGNTFTDPYPETKEKTAVSLAQGINDQFIFYPFSKFRDVRTSFSYFPWWKPYFDVMPNSGAIIGPSDILDQEGNFLTKLLGSITLRQYDYSYLYSFPVMVEIRKFDNNGNEKMFRFALETNIRSNKCFHPEAGMTIEEPKQSLLCDPLFASDNKTIKVFDELTKEPLDDVSLYFHAGDTCILGKTNPSGIFHQGIPQSEGGFLKFQKEGYLDQYLHDSEFNFPLVINLKPLKEFKINLSIFGEDDYFIMRDSNNPYDVRKVSLNDPSYNDTILVVVDRVQESYKDPEYRETLTYTDGELLPETIKLAEGYYNVYVSLFNNSNITLIEELDHVCVAGTGLTSYCVKVPNNPNCTTRGETDENKQQKEWQESNCYKEGYTCESIVDAYTHGSDYLDDSKMDKCGFSQLSGLERLRIQKEEPSRWDSIMTGHYAYMVVNALYALYCDTKKCQADEPIVIEETNVSSFPQGGALFNQTNNYWYIDYNMMGNNTAVQFFMVRHKVPVRHHELNNMMDYMTWSMQTPYLFRPTFN